MPVQLFAWLKNDLHTVCLVRCWTLHSVNSWPNVPRSN